MSRKKKPVKQSRSGRSWFWLLVKIAIVIAVLMGIYGVYLHSQIKERLDGNVWELPAAVYGRTVNLEPGMNYSLSEMVSLLEGMQYRHVNKITRLVNLS